MDRFQQLSVYVAVAEEQGFAAAARRLHMSPPAVTRSVAALESDLGVKLLERSTRLVRTTEVGVRYLEDAAVYYLSWKKRTKRWQAYMPLRKDA